MESHRYSTLNPNPDPKSCPCLPTPHLYPNPVFHHSNSSLNSLQTHPGHVCNTDQNMLNPQYGPLYPSSPPSISSPLAADVAALLPNMAVSHELVQQPIFSEGMMLQSPSFHPSFATSFGYDDLPWEAFEEVLQNDSAVLSMDPVMSEMCMYTYDITAPSSSNMNDEEVSQSGGHVRRSEDVVHPNAEEVRVSSNDLRRFDGYSWRKYGEKKIKNRKFPRSYFRCAQSGCEVKKHIERCSNDPSFFIITRKGKHSHPGHQ